MPFGGRGKKTTTAPAGEVAVDPAAAAAEEQVEDGGAALDAVDVEGLPKVKGKSGKIGGLDKLFTWVDKKGELKIGTMLQSLITVRFDGNNAVSGIYVPELWISNYACLFCVDLAFKGGRGTWRQNLAPLSAVFMAGLLQTDQAKRPGQNNVKRDEDPNKKSSFSAYFNVASVILVGLAGVSVAWRIPYGQQPDYLSKQRFRVSGLLTFMQWTWSKTAGRAINAWI